MREENSRIVVEVKRLPKKILRKLEIELEILQNAHPELTSEFSNMYGRLRNGILDDIGDCARLIEAFEKNEDPHYL